MKFTVAREQLLKPLQQVSGALGSRPSLPILGNILLVVEQGCLSMTGTDLEVEMIAKLALEGDFEEGAVTVPSRKFLDICRGLPDSANIAISLEGDRAIIRSGRSRYTLSVLPAADFPNIEDWQSEVEITLPQGQMRQLIDSTQFSMAHQDVRYYLNGMLFETDGQLLRSVATDGHRMAVCSVATSAELPAKQIIVPRKGVMELMRLLDSPDEEVRLQIGHSNIRAEVNNFVFTSKLVDGRFPDYRRVMPQNSTKVVEASCDELRKAFSRAAILSNEKFRGVRLNLSQGEMRITANNPEQEEAEEFLDVDYEGEPLEIGFNVSYVLDVLNTLKCEQVRWSLTDANASALLEDSASGDAMYVVMPIRL
ncbi:DNA polymerase III subunit beta [Photobacterium sp. BZF1]|uniref:Beta sliding clamp n=1 Tax=Photobacterium rosenbergii TaxID=294936 RepID=A0A2T3N5Y2_9GAMM|nr:MULTISPECIES: DNA polymerase III subunit beta [Photobacterium]MBC7001412.1 DNA polymerase III subunit beta [Photobacterium sp. BZF1]PSW07952.1 DNA polymerase III subunit beta [Photobacterium rosenbergii]